MPQCCPPGKKPVKGDHHSCLFSMECEQFASQGIVGFQVMQDWPIMPKTSLANGCCTSLACKQTTTCKSWRGHSFPPTTSSQRGLRGFLPFYASILHLMTTHIYHSHYNWHTILKAVGLRLRWGPHVCSERVQLEHNKVQCDLSVIVQHRVALQTFLIHSTQT